MALDQIWKQQLTLVTYGNEYLEGNLNFSRWVEHPIFNQNRLIFRDLLSQHLLAQHFQIWLDQQGVCHPAADGEAGGRRTGDRLRRERRRFPALLLCDRL